MKTQPELIALPAPRTRRRHSPEFKVRVIEACLKPGVSIAAVAVANQLNPNFVRKWVKAYRELDQAGVPADCAAARPTIQTTPSFVPVSVQSSPPGDSSAEIRIEIHRQQTVVQISWPVAQSSACAQWLRELLR